MLESHPMILALFQFAPRFGEIAQNLDAIEEGCAGLRADLVVLPELCTTGYQFKDRKELSKLAEPREGFSLRRLSSLAGGLRGHLVVGFAEAEGSRLFNSAALVGPAGVVGLYRKIHLFADERRLFDAGDLGFPVCELAEHPSRKVKRSGKAGDGPRTKIGMMICFDWLFPEAARSLAIGGALVIAHPANLLLPYCQAAMITRALENRVFIATGNRTGVEERIAGNRLHFTGSSQLVGPDGSLIVKAAPDTTEVISATIDPQAAFDKQITPLNHVLRDRRTDQYRLG